MNTEDDVDDGSCDPGHCSLRQAIQCANNHPGPDTISFDIPTTSASFSGTVAMIVPSTALPTITDEGTVIDGGSQTLNRGDTNVFGPEIVLNGRETMRARGLYFRATHQCAVRGLVIQDWSVAAIYMTEGSENTVQGCYIGTDAAGTESAAPDASTEGFGIMIEGGKGHVIGGDRAGASNLISGLFGGVYVLGGRRIGVYSNFMGTDRTGMIAIPNHTDVSLFDGAAANIIGGERFAEGNLLGGKTGIAVTGDDNKIWGNRIGVKADGSGSLSDLSGSVPDLSYAISVFGDDNEIGTAVGNRGNILGGGSEQGALLSVSGSRNVIRDNFIGTDPTGTQDWRAMRALRLSCQGDMPTTSAGNVIARGKVGVAVIEGSTGNTITRNSIFEHEEQGIDLKRGGNTELPTPRSLRPMACVRRAEPPCPAAQPAPAARSRSSQDPEDDGKQFVGSATTAADGTWTTYLMQAPDYDFLTATTTDSQGNTSEFSAPAHVGVACRVPLPVNTGDNRDDGGCDVAHCSLRELITCLSVRPFLTPWRIMFDIPKSDPTYDPKRGVWVLRPQGPWRSIVAGNVFIDGHSQTQNQGDTNPLGPEIVVDGSAAGSASGIVLASPGNRVAGLAIGGFALDGIAIVGGAGNNTLLGNYIGAGPDGKSRSGNGRHGVFIGGSTGEASDQLGAGATTAEQGNQVGPGNIIAYNAGAGVRVEGQAGGQTRITQNSILGNQGRGIELLASGATLPPPVITAVSTTAASAAATLPGGAACAGCTIEFFADRQDEGQQFLAACVTAADGTCTAAFTAGALAYPRVTATSTDPQGNTSEFYAVGAASRGRQHLSAVNLAVKAHGVPAGGDPKPESHDRRTSASVYQRNEP